MNNVPPLAPALGQVNGSPLNPEGGVAPAPTAQEARLAELTDYLNQIRTDSTASFIGKVAYRGYHLGVSEAATVRLLKDHFTQLGYELRRLRIAYFVKGSRRWARDNGEVPDANY